MADESGITWCDSTYNPWIGCTKVGPGCDDCYAWRDFDLRKGVARWGDGNPRHRTKTAKDVRKWEREHEKFFAVHKRKRRVFAASLADIFDNQVDPAWREDFWALVRETPHLEWYIVTKRLPNVAKMLPKNFAANDNNWVLVATVVNQGEWDREGSRLKAIKKMFPWLRVGLSIEPMLDMISLGDDPSWLDWVIVGGESDGGKGTARPMHPTWAELLRKECAAAGVPFHMKQVGNNHLYWDGITDKGKEMSEWPEQLRVREFPAEAA